MRRIVDALLVGLLLLGLACLLYATQQDGAFLVSTVPSASASASPSLTVTDTATATLTATTTHTMTLTAPPTPSTTPTPSATPSATPSLTIEAPDFLTPDETLQPSPSPSEIAVAQS